MASAPTGFESDCVVIWEREAVRAALHEFDLTLDELIEVVEAARWGRNSASQWDPTGFRGWLQYAHATRALRTALAEDRPASRKWRTDNTDGFCQTIDPREKTSITVSSGDEDTGRPDGQPKTRNPKGKCSIRGLRSNRLQMDLFSFDEPADDPLVWVLLIHVDEDEVRAELSLPLGVDETRRIDAWAKRIVIRTDSPPNEGAKADEDDLDIKVALRAG